MITCDSCTYGIHCETWGEWKCTYDSSVVQDPENLICDKYKKLASNEDKKLCHCPGCEERRAEEELEEAEMNGKA